MRIREVTLGDQESIIDLFNQLGYSTEPDQLKKQLHELRQRGSGKVFVAEEAGTVVGVSIVHLITPLHVNRAWALLSALVVDDKQRSSGVGSHLLAAAERFAIEHGCSQLELSSSSARTRAHKFYTQNGYQERRLRFVKDF
jgi:GNAT superfamily N-acetyltransferase